ncbi:MAG: hypothetical protein Q8M31_18940 [Beijerinckiaceae bacterium]|nr:hypothetical protein [Beijerinckiaceae bacterium]
MNRIEHTREGPNIAGISLVLYMLVSILSMMAVYDFKSPDDVRNSVVINLQSSGGSPTKFGEESRNDPIIFAAIEPVAIDARPCVEQIFVSRFQPSPLTRGFNARAPPIPKASAA